MTMKTPLRFERTEPYEVSHGMVDCDGRIIHMNTAVLTVNSLTRALRVAVENIEIAQDKIMQPDPDIIGAGANLLYASRMARSLLSESQQQDGAT